MAKKFKIKAKEKKGVVKVKAMFTSLMAGKEEGIKKGIKQEYIRHVVATINDKIVYEISMGGFMAENPLLKFKTNGGKKGDKIVFTTVDNHGKEQTGKKKIK